jgi:hypothetical protein|tara:strand:- start:1761 stop:2018 length:258 start_codon:yes stop_codon:yes gene_type:complete
MMKKMRAVGIVDFEIHGDYSTVGKIEKEFAAFIKNFCTKVQNDPDESSAPDFAEDFVIITQTQHGMQDRRGTKTGPIDSIVFRNS